MRYALLIVFSCLVGIGRAQTNYPNGVTGCLARWDFANGGPVTYLPDVSGNNHNGTPYGVTTANGFRNIVNGGMRFDGTNGYALIPASTLLCPPQMTIISVVRFHGYHAGSCQGNQIISQGWPYGVQGNWGLSVGDYTYDHDCGQFNPANEQVNTQYGTPPLSIPTAGNYMDTGKWYFVASSFNGSFVKIYTVEMDSNIYHSTISPIYILNDNIPIGPSTANIGIGRHLDPTNPNFVNGDIDELALFNKALSDSEMHEVYNFLWGQLTVSIPDTTSHCDSLTINYSTHSSEIYQQDNVFTVQLSNAIGSFASPINIGSTASDTSGSITCAIPPGTPAGTGYRVRIIASDAHFISADNGTNLSINIPLNVHPHILQTGTTLSLGQNFNSYQWYYNGSPITPGGTGPTYAVMQSGNYFVTISNGNGCTANSDTLDVFAASVNNFNGSHRNISLYPNPVKELLHIDYSNIDNGKIEILDVTGKIIMSQKLADHIGIGELSRGLYMYRITDNDKVITYNKLIKE